MDTQHKYMEIVTWAIEQINTGHFLPGSRFLTEAQLSDRFSCSRQTVRRALEVLVQQGLVTRLQGSGTFIAEDDAHPASQRQRSMTVGMIFTYMDSYIFPSIVRGAGDALVAKGYSMQLLWTDNTVTGESTALRMMMDKELDGLIVEPTRSALPCANIELYHMLADRGTPVVFIDSYYPELTIPHVALDDIQAGWMATAHLVEKGHRRIACILPHTNRQGHLRYLGHVKALREHALPIKEEDILWYSKENMGQLLSAGRLLDFLTPYSAVLCYNDTVALQVMETLAKNGTRVPEQISIIGIDDSEAARYTHLTSIAHPASKLGEAAVAQLLSMIDGKGGKSVLFPPRLVQRSTVSDHRQ
ncbi:MAG: GntR family transcriptional regulator [Sphaerochaeta sp.]|jgi:GntR family transcriptional regulator of arabinose operon|nr:GntR family transcriptional regulator [Sphaerochaeta sp.]MDX9915245.1 GntR family transcriptional regulator [Sphaerochaeta sp.]